MTTSTGVSDAVRVSDGTEWDMTKQSFRLRIIGALLLTTLLSACSAVRLGYEQLPLVVQTWTDRQLDLTAAQSAAVRRAADDLLDWHRREQLPQIADWLAQLQVRALRDTDEHQLCRDAQWLRERFGAVTQRLRDPATELARGLGAAQITRLQDRQHKSLSSWREEWREGSAQAQLQRRIDRTVDRAERVYGRLSPAQRQLVADWLAQDGFDAAAWETERRRRDADLIQTLYRLAANPASFTQSQQAVGAWLAQWQSSPDPAWRATSERQLRNGCVLSARLHNSTSAEQRERAIRTLRGWESDLRALTRPAAPAAAIRAISPGSVGG